MPSEISSEDRLAVGAKISELAKLLDSIGAELAVDSEHDTVQVVPKGTYGTCKSPEDLDEGYAPEPGNAITLPGFSYSPMYDRLVLPQ